MAQRAWSIAHTMSFSLGLWVELVRFVSCLFQTCNNLFDIFIRHTREHGQRNNLLIGSFCNGAQSRAGMEFLPVKRVQVHGDVVNIYPNAVLAQVGEKRCSINAQSTGINPDHIEMITVQRAEGREQRA